MIKLAFNIMSFFWIISPLTFTILRGVKVFDYRCDWAIGAGLGLISFFTMFLTFKSDDKKAS